MFINALHIEQVYTSIPPPPLPFRILVMIHLRYEMITVYREISALVANGRI